MYLLCLKLQELALNVNLMVVNLMMVDKVKSLDYLLL